MFHLVLFQPEIPANTGNIIRLCANTGARLHLIHPLGFLMDDRRLRRAGLDYHEYAEVAEHDTFEAFVASVKPRRLFGLSTHGRRSLFEAAFEPGDAFLLGPETRGLPSDLRTALGENLLRLPMKPHSRSLNLANTAAVVIYEAWRQRDFAAGESRRDE